MKRQRKSLAPSTGLVALYRVSTTSQGESGLGLDAQREIVQRYAASCNPPRPIIAEFTEIESGRTDSADRPELQAAMKVAKQRNATLAVAKLDRLARDVEFVAGVMNSGIDFVVCDSPNESRLSLHIRAAVAEEEARLISERTKAGLAQAKKRGVKLGGLRPGCEAQAAAGLAKGRKILMERRRKEREAALLPEVVPTILRLRNEGKTFRDIAAALNAAGHRKIGGQEWDVAGMEVWRLAKRYGGIEVKGKSS